MRARNLKPAFFKNEDLADLPFECRLLFQGLWCLADKTGRLENRAKRIKADIFPYDNVDVAEGLSRLAAKGFLILYEINGTHYIEITKFTRHQKCHPNEKCAGLPGPPEKTHLNPIAREKVRRDNNLIQTDPASLLNDECGMRNEESPLIEPPMRNEESGIVSSEPDKPASEPPLVIFPVVAPEGKPKTWGLTVAKVTEYQQTYTGVDVLAECRKALQWCRDNPAKRKTAKGMPAFLNRWLEKAQNNGGGTRGHPHRNGVSATIGSYLDKYGGRE